jgi:hypothetical protein
MRNEYYLYGDVPVHIIKNQNGYHVEALDWVSGKLETHMEYLAEIDFDRSGLAREVTEERFQQHLAEQQAKWRENRAARAASAI